MNGDTLLPFKAIHTFVMSLNEEFGARQKSLRLYARLIEHTTFSPAHELPIRKHVQAFTSFCTRNRDAIYEKEANRLDFPRIEYSERVYIDLKELFRIADADQRQVMWQHVLTISALVDGTGRAKQILKENQEAPKSNEGDFLSSILDKVEKTVKLDNTSNPMEAITQIMSSGLFSELMGSMNSQVNAGQLDLGKMMGMVQGMMSTITKDNPQMSQMLETMMKSLPIPSGESTVAAPPAAAPALDALPAPEPQVDP